MFPRAALEGLDALELDEETRAAFLCGNAQRLLDLPVQPAGRVEPGA